MKLMMKFQQKFCHFKNFLSRSLFLKKIMTFHGFELIVCRFHPSYDEFRKTFANEIKGMVMINKRQKTRFGVCCNSMTERLDQNKLHGDQ